MIGVVTADHFPDHRRHARVMVVHPLTVRFLVFSPSRLLLPSVPLCRLLRPPLPPEPLPLLPIPLSFLTQPLP